MFVLARNVAQAIPVCGYGVWPVRTNLNSVTFTRIILHSQLFKGIVSPRSHSKCGVADELKGLDSKLNACGSESCKL